MIAVLFELWPCDGRIGDYMDIAAELAPELSSVDGFVSIERFQSLSSPGKLLSLSYWRDEAAVASWRNSSGHRSAQVSGRAGILADYRLRVAAVLRDYALRERAQTPEDSRMFHLGDMPPAAPVNERCSFGGMS